ncbi:alpha/beta fold hydrolase [Nocardia sienata]|uniref:alpha/beta fold hydrolase n=1 Tax=Nocardia sienata TaxID=248552 RepID=UPI0007A544EC
MGQDYGLSQLRADVLGVCDASALERPHLVSHDCGAIVAWDVAARQPDRIASLTTVSVPHPAAFAWARDHDPGQTEKAGGAGHWVPEQAPDEPAQVVLARVAGS